MLKRRREAGGGTNSTTSIRQARQSALDKDQQTWEENRLLSSGAALRSEVDLDFNNENDDTRVQLLVHQIQPPFLRDGRAAFRLLGRQYRLFEMQLVTLQGWHGRGVSRCRGYAKRRSGGA